MALEVRAGILAFYPTLFIIKYGLILTRLIFYEHMSVNHSDSSL